MLALAQWRESDGALAEFSERIEAAAWGVAPHLRSLHRDPHQTTGFAQVVARLGEEARFRGIALPVQPGRHAVVDRRREWRPSRSPGPTGQYPLATRSLELYETAWVLSQLSPWCMPTPPCWPRAGPRAGAPASGGDRSRSDARRSGGPGGRGAGLPGAALGGRTIPIPPACCASSRPNTSGRRPPPTPPLGSVTAHAHLLEALRAAPAVRRPRPGRAQGRRRSWPARRPPITSGRTRGHASPYLPTAQALVALGPQLTLAREAVHYLLRTQRPDGSWGRFEAGTAEETAYCVQALGPIRRPGRHRAPPRRSRPAARWLETTRERQGAVTRRCGLAPACTARPAWSTRRYCGGAGPGRALASAGRPGTR